MPDAARPLSQSPGAKRNRALRLRKARRQQHLEIIADETIFEALLAGGLLRQDDADDKPKANAALTAFAKWAAAEFNSQRVTAIARGETYDPFRRKDQK